ncbi:hypothetical protein [Phytohabitans kaempferiae]|uniref:Uncharacterized protein n=1 Tax=Phytohabitans kaempferiae TaxID=1620943 RepID=A0ABV6MD47_9ACTN
MSVQPTAARPWVVGWPGAVSRCSPSHPDLDQLTSLVASRRDATLEPAPKSTEQLAVRLLHPSSMAGACALLTLPQLQAGEVAAGLGDGCTAARLAMLLGVPADDPDLGAALRRLTQLALIWPHAGGFVAAHLSAVWPHPLMLGPGAAELFSTQNMNELRRLAKLYGVPVAGVGKNELVVALSGWLAQPENVRRVVAQAPADVCVQLGMLARRPASPFGLPGITLGAPGMALPWATEHGLLVGSGWGGGEMPREVALALREGYVAPFDPRPPTVSVTRVEPEAAEREAAAAAVETLAAITATVETMSIGPAPAQDWRPRRTRTSPDHQVVWSGRGPHPLDHRTARRRRPDAPGPARQRSRP